MNARQQRFVDEYLLDLNATQAATRAGYSKKTAGQIGERLLKNVEVKKAVDAAIARRAAKSELKSEDVLRWLGSALNADPRRLFDKRGRLLPPHKWPDDLALVIQSVEPGKVRLVNKQGVAQLIGQHLGTWDRELRIKADVAVSPAIDVSKATDDQLRAIQAALSPILAAPAGGNGPEPTGDHR